MPPDRFPPDDPREWLNRARGNLARAGTRLPEAYLEDLCFDAQQAAEKAIKALLIRKKKTFPRVHDITRLLTLLEEAGEAVPAVVLETGELSRYAVVTRYPGIVEPVNEEQYRTAITHATAVVRWVEERMASDT